MLERSEQEICKGGINLIVDVAHLGLQKLWKIEHGQEGFWENSTTGEGMARHFPGLYHRPNSH